MQQPKSYIPKDHSNTVATEFAPILQMRRNSLPRIYKKNSSSLLTLDSVVIAENKARLHTVHIKKMNKTKTFSYFFCKGSRDKLKLYGLTLRPRLHGCSLRSSVDDLVK